ncbi:MAG TPA: T9SS type A sorting domain-containing protein, partial [Chitinophagales bacterium]|nr:T9SS type A sorting domain-containing protein [Chitinophagales bacterium]
DHTAQNHGYWSFASTNTGYTYDMEVFANAYAENEDANSTWRVIKHEAGYGDDPSSSSTDWTPEIETSVNGTDDLLTYTRNAGCYSGAGVPGGLYTDFSHFTMAMTNSNNALPVKFLYVYATPTGKHHIEVSWATAVEINNAGFEVTRSTDAVNFVDVGWVEGHGTTTEKQTYTFDDKVPDENVTYYYRLRQTDYNQQTQLSNIAQAKLVNNTQSGFALYPNPTASQIFLTFDSPGNEINVVLYDMQGRQAYQNIYTIEDAGSRQTVSLNASSLLPPGTYLLTASTNGAQYKAKVVLQ